MTCEGGTIHTVLAKRETSMATRSGQPLGFRKDDQYESYYNSGA